MKKLILSTLVLSVTLFSTNSSIATIIASENSVVVKHDDKKTDSFKVYGNCGMCEKTIEGALKNVKGIDKADWNQETKMMEVVYHTHDISLAEIKKKIAKVGYDSEGFRATEETYNNLPGCCQYERPEAKKEDHSGHKH
ncbi:MAG: heavy-metal-associated domain-containing protein [Flavobacteriales bacterium]|nr:heavy-metal-associated domain-containing protein [Flavobacteriales bacterium]